MGEFSAGKWIIGLFIYFFLFFIITLAVVNETDDPNIQFTDPGFGSSKENNSATDDILFGGEANDTVDFSKAQGSYNSWKASLSIMTGINSANIKIGVPSEWQFIFSFFLFWLPFIMLLWSIYMALPFLH